MRSIGGIRQLDSWGLPAPYPDEIATSVVARYLANWGFIDNEGMLKRTFGHVLRPSFIDCMDLFSIIGTPNDSSIQLRHIYLHTFAPYQMAFWPKRLPTRDLTLLAPRQLHLLFRQSYRRSHQEFMKFCGSCLMSELNKTGEPYWHRIHQLPGQTYCPKHSIALAESSVPARAKNWKLLRPPGRSMMSDIYGPQKRIFDEEIASFVDSQNSRLISSKSIGRFATNRESYRRILKKLGFETRTGLIEAGRLQNEFTGWLKKHAAHYETFGDDAWLQSIYTNIGTAPSPLQHLIFRKFLQSVFCVSTAADYATLIN